MSRRPEPAALPTPPTTFFVGPHKLVVHKAKEHRWTAVVDGQPVDGAYDTQAEAWEAGVRFAARLDAAG